MSSENTLGIPLAFVLPAWARGGSPAGVQLTEARLYPRSPSSRNVRAFADRGAGQASRLGLGFLSAGRADNGDNRRGPTFLLHPGAAAPAQAGSGVVVLSCLKSGHN
jgi:hypothetical protein